MLVVVVVVVELGRLVVGELGVRRQLGGLGPGDLAVGGAFDDHLLARALAVLAGGLALQLRLVGPLARPTLARRPGLRLIRLVRRCVRIRIAREFVILRLGLRFCVVILRLILTVGLELVLAVLAVLAVLESSVQFCSAYSRWARAIPMTPDHR